MKQVYFMRPIGMAGPVKVGCSVMPKDRLKALDIWSPFPLEIIASAPGSHCNERAVHWHLRDDRLHGEWFRWSERLSALVSHVQRAGSLPPLEASPYGKTGKRRGNNPSRHPEWTKEKTQLTARVSRAERHAFGWSGNGIRPKRISDLIASYHGPFTPPPTLDVRTGLEAYISELLARPKDRRNWRDIMDERASVLGFNRSAA